MAQAKPIKHFGTVITGKTPSTDCLEYYGNDIPFIKTPDMHGTPFVTTTECYLSKLGAESQTNKYIPEFSLIVACIGANAGEVAITTYQAQTNQQINAAITDYPCTLYFAIKDAREELRALGDGSSTMLNINKSSFENFELLLPCKEGIVKLECLLRSVFDYIHFNVLEINLLEEYKALLVTTLSR
ncbi:restriction endonuclease subunit S [Eubacterium oxidoreducens]|uniref:Type I restriction modification DNA specificity domain-containing protein n=1 Tax=Eubacterium oxidoreducens TaxID=1732 RepID=A0A1G6CMC9_EUBOX|nr:restriction endonuclease subunit S [Eubacterium oxidoreducens]SDB34036.1 Type I restriction modification DNA specificity domain-containing protein [Eubacterium oxidoreducens]